MAISRFSKNLISISIVFFAVLASLSLIRSAQAQASRNSAISLEKDSNNLFTITVRDPQGIREFSLQPPGKFSYGGLIGGCPSRRTINNVIFDDPTDFTPAMKAYVVDCSDNKDELEIPPPKNGETASVRMGMEQEQEQEQEQVSLPAAETQKASVVAPPKQLDIAYPVKELGNCGSEFECRVYCDDPANMGACLDFAEKHNLADSEEIARGKKFKQLLDRGNTPGGCDSQQACEVYCNDIDRLDECLSFGEKNGFLGGKELEEAKKINQIIKSGRKLPGDCRNKTACEAYCKNSGHMEECLAFAKENGFISEKELAEAEKFLPLIKEGKTPGACQSKEECETYCESDEHIDECVDFAVKNDLIPKEERDRVEAFKKAGGRGPGGCRGRQCQIFCENPDNQKACFAWAKENGLLREEDLRRMDEGRQQIKKAFEDAPPEARSCIEEAIPGGLSAVESGDFFGGPEIGEKIRGCFESVFSKFGPPAGEPPMGDEGGGPPTGEFSGPGGCKGIDECFAYCKEHLDECAGFAGQDGGGPAGGPGGVPGGSGFVPPPAPEFQGRSGEGCVPPPSGLAVWLRGDSISEGSAGGVTIADGKVGKAFKFDGSGYVNLGNPANLNFGTGPFSLEAWFNWVGGLSVNNIIRKSDYPSSGSGSGYWLRAGNGTLEFSVGATTGPEGQTLIVAPVSSGVWHHAVAVKTSSGDAQLYLDGQPSGTIIRQSSITDSTSEDPFVIGAWRGSAEFFNGLIDEVSAYNRALSQSEVQAIFNAGSAGKCSGGAELRQRPQESPVEKLRNGFAPPSPEAYPIPSPEEIQRQYQEEIQKQYQEQYQKQYEQQIQQFQQQYQQQIPPEYQQYLQPPQN